MIKKVNNFVRDINTTHFNLDLEYLFQNSKFLFSGYFVTVFTTIATTYILANYAPEHIVGVYRYVFSWYSILAAIMLGSVASSLSISIAEGKHSFLQAIKYKSYFSMFGFVFANMIGLYYLLHGNTELFYNFLALSIAAPVMEISSLLNSYYQGKSDFKSLSILSIVSKFSSLLFIILFLVFLPTSYSLLLSTLLIPGIIQFIYSYGVIKKIYKYEILKKNRDPNLLRNSLHLTLMGIIFTLGGQLDKTILFTVFGSTALASYWVLGTIPTEAQRFILQISSLYLPKFVQKDSSNQEEHFLFKKKFIKVMFVMSFGLIALSGVYYLISPLVFKFLFPKYLDYITYSQIMFTFVVFTPFMFIWNFFLAQKRTSIMYFYHIIDPIIQILFYLIFVFVFKMQILGIILAIILKNIFMSISGLYLLIKN